MTSGTDRRSEGNFGMALEQKSFLKEKRLSSLVKNGITPDRLLDNRSRKDEQKVGVKEGDSVGTLSRV